MALLSRKQILNPLPLYRDVLVHEWSGEVRVSAMSLRTRIDFFDVIREIYDAEEKHKADPEANPKPKLGTDDLPIIELIFSLEDADGRMFTLDDYDALLDLPSKIIGYLHMHSKALNEFGTLGDEQLREIEKKESEQTLNSDSPIDSPDTSAAS